MLILPARVLRYTWIVQIRLRLDCLTRRQAARAIDTTNMPRLILTLLLTSGAAMRFEEFELAFGKKYSSRERFVRRAHFEQSLQRVAAHNAGDHTWRAGINQFSDLSDEEFKSKVLMRPQKCSATNTVGVPGGAENKKKPADLPPSIDWRSRGIVSEVKNQGADPVSSDRSPSTQSTLDYTQVAAEAAGRSLRRAR